ncbi:MAG TPA: type II secretion system F family protein [Chthonomonadales bacterium]|nr:type II secretion system F family protein [Chthonomonadales bacterium]
MSFFRYEAIDRAGKTVIGTMDADSESVVSARLMQMGYRPQRIIPSPTAPARIKAGAQTASRMTVPDVSRLGGAGPKDLALFFRQFAALVRSGITLYQALDNLGPRTANPALARTAREMAETAHNGGRISDVMERYPRLYAPHVVASVRAGELGGFLEIVLDEIAYDYEQEIAFYKGMWLPKLLVIQGLLALAIAQPLFPTLFPDNRLPDYLRLVFLRNIPITIGLLLLFRLWYAWMQAPTCRAKRDALVLRVPVFGDLARQRSLAAFVRMLRRLFAAGIGPIGAWEGAMNVAPNAVIRAKLIEAYAMIRQNIPLHEAFIATGLFANQAEQLLATGVLSGQIVDMLDRVAEYYQDNVQRAFDSARFWMYRLGFSIFLALSGAVLILLTKTYFDSIFRFAESLTE